MDLIASMNDMVQVLEIQDRRAIKIIQWYNKQYANLKYIIIEKQAYAMVKTMKLFRGYVLHYKIIAYVP